jgi:hypothetical protein
VPYEEQNNQIEYSFGCPMVNENIMSELKSGTKNAQNYQYDILLQW